MGENNFARHPTALYGVALLMPAIAYYILQRVIIRSHGKHSHLARAIGKDFKGRISPILYIVAIVFAFFIPWISYTISLLVALMWLLPDRRIETTSAT